MELYSGDDDFSASEGGLRIFSGDGLSLWCKTTVSHRLPQDIIPKVSSSGQEAET